MDNGGNVITFSRPYTRKLLMLRHLDARGVEPVSIDVRLRVSADVLLEGTHEQADRRGLFLDGGRCYPFCYHIPGYGQRLEKIKFAIFYRVF